VSDGGALVPRLGQVALLAVLLATPLYLDGSWLIIGCLAMAAAVGAVGLTLLLGTAGLLSLAHAFFLAVGAYTYAYLAGAPADGGDTTGLGWPPLLAALGGLVASGLAGLAFSPAAGRVRGLYLGVASLALVFIGQHVLNNLDVVTGGFNGRSVEVLSVGGFELTGSDPGFSVLGVPYGPRERLWYLCLLVLIGAVLFARNVVRSRPGRALVLMRDNASAASAMGVPVQRYKAAVFVLSSVYAGAAGILTALAFQFIVPQYFGLALSVNFLAMVVIGGLGSVAGAVLGATFVAALPLLLDRFSGALPFLAEPGAGGVDAGILARLVFGAAIVLTIVLEPGGLAAAGRRLRRRRPPQDRDASPVDPPGPALPPEEERSHEPCPHDRPDALASDRRSSHP
jgi:branched-chain amino acid transport system permease protein